MKKIIILVYLFVIQTISASAQPGTPDASFGNGGKVLSATYEGVGNTVAVQADGKIVVGGVGGWYDADSNFIAGYLAVRYNADGTIDESFGDAGRAINNLADPEVSKEILKIAVQPDGKIVAAGTYGAALALIRYNTDGSIDTEFGDGGIAIYKPSQQVYHIMRDMALLPDGMIVVAGDLHANDNDNRRSFIFCYNTNGTVDNSFGDNGEVIINSPENAFILALSITKTGKILVGGNYFNIRKTILYQYNDDGTPDESFGENGFAYMNYGTEFAFPGLIDMVVTKDNKIITLCGTRTSESNPNYVLLTSRFLANGTPDSSYGTYGYNVTSFDKTTVYAKAMVINAEENLLITGTMNGLITGTVVISIAPDGQIDSSFGTNGIAKNTFVENGSNDLNSIALQEDGKIVVAGYGLYQNYPYYRYYYILGRFEGYGAEKNKYVKIKHWLHQHGFTWEDWPGKNNISTYTIERSSNGNSFTAIGQLLRNSSGQYHFEDVAPLSGNNYYRVAAASSSGAVTYSNVLAIPNNDAVIVYPNPVQNSISITGLSATEKTSLRITDLNGNTKASTTITGSSYNWNISSLPKGNYVLQVTGNDGNVITKKLVKE